MNRTYLCLLFFAALPLTAVASEEDFVPWENLSVKSVELPEVGVIKVDASVITDSYKKFAIVAFGRTNSLSDSELKRLAGFPLSSLVITHEAGYAALGGHTLHLRMRRSYRDSAKGLIHETVIISIPKNAELQISVKAST